MPRDGIDEDDLFDEDDFEDEFDDGENEKETELDDRYKKLVEQAKKEAEEAVVEALVKGDTNTPIYKGLQRHLNARDRRIQDLENALADAINRQRSSANELEFLSTILPELIDPKDREVFNNRKTNFMTEKRANALEELLKNRTTPPPPNQYRNDDDDFQQKVAEYRKMAEDQLKEIAEISGVDPEDKRLNYGDPEESLVQRLAAFKESISKIKKEDDEINSVRKKKQAITRTRGESSPDRTSYGDEIISRGLAQILKRMEKE